MPFNGSGTFVRVYNWLTDKINGVNITASRVDTEDDGFAAGLTNCVTRDGQGKMGTTFTPSSDAAYDVGAPSAQWRIGYFSGSVFAQDYVQNTGVGLLLTAQSVTNSNTPAVIPSLGFVPVSPASYLIEARLCMTANTAAGPGGVRCGLYTNFVNADHELVTVYGNVNGTTVPTPIGFASSSANAPTISYTSVSTAGFAANWLEFKGTINILNVTGSAVIGLHFCQNTAIPGGTLTVETPSYIKATRVS